MNSLVENLCVIKNDKNSGIVEELISIIEEEGINTIDELELLQKEEGPIEKTVLSYLKEIDNSWFEYDGRLYDEIQRLKIERNLIGDAKSPESLKHLIVYCSLTNRDNPLPFTTYQMLLRGEI